MIAATAQCWQGMALGNDDFALVEEGRSTLLVASGASWAWHRERSGKECRFEDLLRRAEE